MDEKSNTNVGKSALENLSREELLEKYKGLLNIAKKAKQTKDELSKENCELKEELTRSEMQKNEQQDALKTMQELLDQFTDQKLETAMQLNELKQQHKSACEKSANMEIENESLRRQLQRATDENENLLAELSHMEAQLQQVNVLGKEQHEHLTLLEHEMNKLKASEQQVQELQSALATSAEKYDFVKSINTEQRQKFNALKDRFIEVHRKLKKLQECKRVLLETQHEYAEAVSKWQREIVEASEQLCARIDRLELENKKLTSQPADLGEYVLELERLTDAVWQEQNNKEAQIGQLQAQQAEVEKMCLDKCAENVKLRSALEETHDALEKIEQENIALLEQLQNQGAAELINTNSSTTSEQENVIMLSELQAQNVELMQQVEQLKMANASLSSEHADLLGEMRELNEALKGRGDVITRQQEKQQELMKKLQQCESAHEEQVRTLSAELQKYKNQASMDDTQSDISSMSRAEEVNRLREADECFEEKYNKLRGLAVKLKKKLQEQSVHIEELEETQRSYVKLQQQHKELAQLAENTKAENHKLKNTRSQQVNLLNLEIEAAEKTLKEHAEKLQVRMQEVKVLQEQLAGEHEQVQQLRKQINILEEEKMAECAHARQLKAQVDLQQQQIKDALHEKQQVCLIKQQLEQQLQKQQADIDEMRLQLTAGVSKQAENMEKMHAKYEQLEREYCETREALKNAEMQLKTCQDQLEVVRVEYVDYKLKAQTVLRKQQSSQENVTKMTQLQEELVALQRNEQDLLTQQQKCEQRNKQLTQDVEHMTVQHEQLLKRQSELLATVETLKSQNDRLAQDNRLQLLQQQEALAAQRQQMEQLKICHEQQMKEQQSRHEQQLKALEDNKVSKIANHTSSAEQSKIDFLLMEREDAEGSEEVELTLSTLAANRKISSASRPHQLFQQQHEFMPLDELLNAPISAISDTVTTISGNSMLGGHAGHNDMDEELIETRERLEKQERQLRHMTALLAENEQDLAKLTQMNDMLKEELRRQERSVEREQHMHNSEYLKNVVLKFLTLNNNDERARLVPVLNTILKLSRSETDALNSVAKGQKVSNNTWNSFLPWGGATN